MKIFVPVKRVPDYAVKVKVASDGMSIQENGIKWIVNPFDEIAVEEALRIKELRPDTEIVVASVGPPAVSEQLRTALAMGADRAILAVTTDYVDSDLAYRSLRALIQKDDYRLIIMGKQAIDSDANQTGQLLAASLNYPQATFASKLVIADDWSSATVTREVDGGLETVSVTLPAVVTTDLRLNEPRYPSLPGIVKAKKKPLEDVALANLGLQGGPKIRIAKMEMPPARKGGIKVQSVNELIEKLTQEAKIL
jgi:electron transfer flavoprotein beta subunit